MSRDTKDQLTSLSFTIGAAWMFLSAFYEHASPVTALTKKLHDHFLFVQSSSLWNSKLWLCPMTFDISNLLFSFLRLCHRCHAHINVVEMCSLFRSSPFSEFFDGFHIISSLLRSQLRRASREVAAPPPLLWYESRILPALLLECFQWCNLYGSAIVKQHFCDAIACMSLIGVGDERVGIELINEVLFNAKALVKWLNIEDDGDVDLKRHCEVLKSLYSQLLCPSSPLPLSIEWLYFPLSKMDFPSEPQNAAKELISSSLWYLKCVQPLWIPFIEMDSARSIFHALQVFLQAPTLWHDNQVMSSFQDMIHQCLDLLPNNSNLHKVFMSCLSSKLESQNKIDEQQSEKAKKTKILDFITAFTQQFVHESAGQKLFGKCLALFLHRSFSVDHRLLVWKELNSQKRWHSISSFHHPSVIQSCLFPIEVNHKILQEHCVLLKQYSQKWENSSRGDFLYGLSIHSICAYLFRDDASCTLLKQREDKEDLIIGRNQIPLLHPKAWARQQMAHSLFPHLCEEIRIDLMMYQYQPAFIQEDNSFIAFPSIQHNHASCHPSASTWVESRQAALSALFQKPIEF